MPKRKPRETTYTNTDFDLKSVYPFDVLRQELEATCCVLHYTHGDDGNWHSIVESLISDDESLGSKTAEMDIRFILDVLARLSPKAKIELNNCYMKEFNIGIDCWDTWSYGKSLSAEIVRDVAEYSCSLAVTLYPMRNPDGTPKD